MAETLVNQAYGLIEAAEAALKASKKDLPDAQTIGIARAITLEAQRQRPNDPVLKTISFANPPDWAGILAAMKIVTRTIS